MITTATVIAVTYIVLMAVTSSLAFPTKTQELHKSKEAGHESPDLFGGNFGISVSRVKLKAARWLFHGVSVHSDLLREICERLRKAGDLDTLRIYCSVGASG